MAKTPGIIGKLGIGFILYVVLPLLGWGILDLSGFFSHPARLVYVILIIVLQTVLMIRFPAMGREAGAGKKVVARQRVTIVLLQLLSLAVVFFAPFDDRRELLVLSFSDLWRISGLVLIASGFTLMAWAEEVLGRLFSTQVTIQEGHQLVTSGPYRHLRHPRYLGIILFNIGMALTFRSGLTLILTFALTIVLLWRIHDEEKLLREEFAAAWEAYAQRSWRLVPFLY